MYLHKGYFSSTFVSKIRGPGHYDKDKGEFTKRSQGSTRVFPDIDRGALGYVRDMIGAANGEKDDQGRPLLERLQQAQRAAANQDVPASELITQEKARAFSKFSFAKQYAEAIKQKGEITPEMREETRGRWVRYQKGTDPTALWASLQNKGTAWCTKGFATAETQLKDGDFYVYYTLDRQGKPTIPRIAIRMQEDQIGEVRGVADNNQNLEGNMAGIAEEKMEELPGAERYKKASADMKRLTAIEKKTKAGEALAKDDLVFLYELDARIKGFGYQKDPRIAELRDKRSPIDDIHIIYGHDLSAANLGKEALDFIYEIEKPVPWAFVDKVKKLRAKRDPEADMPIVFDCGENQIARNIKDIKDGTKAYVGPLVPGIFDKIQEYGIEHVYASFPEGRVRKETIKIGGRNAKTLLKEMDAKNIIRTISVEDMLKSEDFKVLKKTEEAILIRLEVRDLGFPEDKCPTTDEIYKRIEELGLELCPPETGPHYRLKYTNQPMGEWLNVGMKQITDRDGYPSVFCLARRGDGLWLRGDRAFPNSRWLPGNGFVVRLRRRTKAKLGAGQAS